ncbi:MAG: N4-gp56 family major capsid protein, partial [Deltaproteobacteria bacterium]
MSNFDPSPITQADNNGAYAKGTDTSHRSYNAPYGDPETGVSSNIGTQFNTFYWQKKALIELKKEMFFGQLADTTSMPKHFGKKIKKYHYLPLLDDRNMNDQGIDAAGVATGDATAQDAYLLNTWVVYHTALATGNEIGHMSVSDDASAALTAAQVVAEWNRRYPDGPGADGTVATHAVEISGASPVANAGNMYGSSKDVGTISAKMPALSEHGGRVNRVGFKRIELEGSLEKFGFFDEYTQESMDFDSDSELMMHVNREMLRGANEMTEDALQIDLLNAAGVVRFANAATSVATIDVTDLVTYDDLQKLSRDLDDNRMPKNTKIITGSRMIDTRTIDGARY